MGTAWLALRRSGGSGTLLLCAVYRWPNATAADDERLYEAIERVIAGGRPVIVVGDFNAHAEAFGGTTTNAHGNRLCQLAEAVDMSCLNPIYAYGEATYSHAVLDLCFVANGAGALATGLSVGGGLMLQSDHQPLSVSLAVRMPRIHHAPRWQLGDDDAKWGNFRSMLGDNLPEWIAAFDASLLAGEPDSDLIDGLYARFVDAVNRSAAAVFHKSNRAGG